MNGVIKFIIIKKWTLEIIITLMIHQGMSARHFYVLDFLSRFMNFKKKSY